MSKALIFGAGAFLLFGALGWLLLKENFLFFERAASPPPRLENPSASLLARSPCRGQGASSGAMALNKIQIDKIQTDKAQGEESAALATEKALGSSPAPPVNGAWKKKREKKNHPLEKSFFSKLKAKPGARPPRLAMLNRLAEQPLDWIIEDINGKVIDFYCYRGKARLALNLWATWCPPCIEELPSLSRLAQKSAGSVLIAAISTEPKEKVRRFIQKSFPDLSARLRIAVLSAAELGAFFPEDPLPVTYLFNKEGKLAHKAAGPRKWDTPDLMEQIQGL